MGRRSSGIRGNNTNNSSKGERVALEDYVSGEYMYINQALRGNMPGWEMQQDEKNFISNMDKVTRANIDNKILYRSVDAKVILSDVKDRDLSDFISAINNEQQLKNSNSTWGKNALVKAEQIKANTLNRVITERGFMSTTKTKDIADDWGSFSGAERPVTLVIHTSNRARGVDLTKKSKSLSSLMGQDEVILKRDTKYKILKIKPGVGASDLTIDVELL